MFRLLRRQALYRLGLAFWVVLGAVACNDSSDGNCEQNSDCLQTEAICVAGRCCPEGSCDPSRQCQQESCAGITFTCAVSQEQWQWGVSSVQCDDQDPCTLFDACVQGECHGMTMECPAGEQCVLGLCQCRERTHTLNLHAPYNSSGSLAVGGPGADFPDLDSFLSYVDQKILKLGNCGIEMIRASGKSGLIAKVDPNSGVSEDPGCQDDQAFCRHAAFLPEPMAGWAALDAYVRHASEKLQVDLMLEINLPEMVPDPDDGNYRPYFRSRQNVETLQELLRRALMRYDGDCDINDDGDCADPGEERGFPKVAVWQLGNEPGGDKWVSQERATTAQGEVMLLAAATHELGSLLHSECPDCVLVLAGVGGDTRPPYWLDFLSGTDDCVHPVCGYYRHLLMDLNLLAGAGRRDFDVFDFHYHHQPPTTDSSWQQVKVRIQAVRQLLDSLGHASVPIWISETSSWSGQPSPDWGSYPPHTEEEQASELIKRFFYPFALGVEKVFWSPGLLEYGSYGGPTNTDGYFSHVGLLDKRGAEKAAYRTLQVLLQELKAITTVVRIYDGSEASLCHPFFPGLFLLRVQLDGTRLAYLVWNEDQTDPAPVVDLSADILGTNFEVLDLIGENTGESPQGVAFDHIPKVILSKR